jgi:hypothetical protein
MTELAELAGTNASLLADALHELYEKDLLATEPQIMQSTVPGVSRREAIIRAARYGAAAAGASLIVSATAATPAMASSEAPCRDSEGCVEAVAVCCCCKDGKGATGSEGETCEAVCLRENKVEAAGVGLQKRRFSGS